MPNFNCCDRTKELLASYHANINDWYVSLDNFGFKSAERLTLEKAMSKAKADSFEATISNHFQYVRYNPISKSFKM